MCLFVDAPALYDMYQGTTWRTRSTRSYDSQKREVLGDFDGISAFALVAELPASARVAACGSTGTPSGKLFWYLTPRHSHPSPHFDHKAPSPPRRRHPILTVRDVKKTICKWRSLLVSPGGTESPWQQECAVSLLFRH